MNDILLENQISSETGFILTKSQWESAPTFDLSYLNIAEEGCEDDLQFGDERFFYGNIRTDIGACVYKSIFDLKIDSNDFKKTDNPTWVSTQDLAFNEIGIYDEQQELVIISKVSKPQTLDLNSIFKVEVSLDF